MSYDISVIDPSTDTCVRLNQKLDLTQGTMCIGGSDWAEFNITYNYGKFYVTVFGENGIRSLDGIGIEQLIPLLVKAIRQLNGEPSSNYWDSTEGNAKTALVNLLTLIIQAYAVCPEATLRVY